MKRARPSRPALVLAVLFLASLACTLTDLIEAADIPNLIVTKTDDTDDGACTESDCSLREAVLAANATPESDTIFVPAGVYVLTLHGEGDAHFGSLNLTADVIILGADPETTIIDGDAADRIFYVNSDITVDIRSLTIRNGHTPNTTEGGGGIEIRTGAVVTLDEVNVLDNLAEADLPESLGNLGGGGIWNQGTLTILGGRIAGNRSSGGGGIYNGGSLEIDGAVIEDNEAKGSGGGISSLAGGSIIIRSTIIRDNLASGGVVTEGGGISSFADMQIQDSTISGNRADGSGGGIRSYGSILEVTDSIVTQNTADLGGGITIGYGGMLTVQASQIAGNHSTRDGGGLLVANGAAATLQDVTVEANLADGSGAGLFSNGTLTILDSLIQDNQAQADGGGVYSHSTLDIISSTLQANTAAGNGGGASIIYTANMESSTVSGNTAGGVGGGLYVNSPMTLANCTISGNTAASSGGGVYLWAGGPLDFRHCTLALNSAPTAASLYSLSHVELRGTILFADSGGNCILNVGGGGGGNLDSDGTCGYPDGNSLNGLDPLLGPLADNGGPTLTHALLPGSPALDAWALGVPPVCLLDVDQRGITRPQGPGCDIGAYEAEGPMVVTVQPILPTATVPPTVLPLQPSVVGDVDSNCRLGPGTLYPVQGALRQGEQAFMDGRNPDSSWVHIRLGNGILCWVWVGNVTVEGELSGLPVLAAPPLPTATFTVTPPATVTPTFTAIP